MQDEYDEALENVRAILDDQEGDLWEASDWANHAVRLRPSSPECWILKAQVMSGLEDDAAALAAAEMALRLSPHWSEAHFWRAAALADMEHYADALQALDRAFRYLAEKDDHRLLEDLYCEKAAILDATGKVDEALETYEQGLRRVPDSQTIRAALEPLRKERVRRTFKLLPGGLT
jgi:tetratricopeptide (TPR) repeat protein